MNFKLQTGNLGLLGCEKVIAVMQPYRNQDLELLYIRMPKSRTHNKPYAYLDPEMLDKPHGYLDPELKWLLVDMKVRKSYPCLRIFSSEIDSVHYGREHAKCTIMLRVCKSFARVLRVCAQCPEL